MTTKTQPESRPSLVTRRAVRGALLGVGAAFLMILLWVYVNAGIETASPSRYSGYAGLLFHPLLIPFVCLGIFILSLASAPFGALVGVIVGRTQLGALVCSLIGAAIAAPVPTLLLFTFVLILWEPSWQAPTLWDAIGPGLARPENWLGMGVSAAVAAAPGALLGWRLWHTRETWLREIEWVEAGKPLDWRWKKS